MNYKLLWQQSWSISGGQICDLLTTSKPPQDTKVGSLRRHTILLHSATMLLIHQNAPSLVGGRCTPSCPPRALKRALRSPSMKVSCFLVHSRVTSGPSTSARQLHVMKPWSRGSSVKVQAVFEKFTERSIKSVMIAQQEAKLLGSQEVGHDSKKTLLSAVPDQVCRCR